MHHHFTNIPQDLIRNLIKFRQLHEMGLGSSLNEFLRSPLALTFTPESALPGESKEMQLFMLGDAVKTDKEEAGVGIRKV